MFYSILLRHLPLCTADQEPQNLTESGRSYSSSTSEEILHWSLSAIASPEHTGGAVEDWSRTCGCVLITELSWLVKAPAEANWTSRLGLYYSFLPFTFPHWPFFTNAQPLCQDDWAQGSSVHQPHPVPKAAHPCGFWALRVRPNHYCKSPEG